MASVHPHGVPRRRWSCCLILVCALHAALRGADSLEIVTPYARVHLVPLDSARLLFMAEQGQRYAIRSEQAGWCQIATEDTAGWVRKRDARPCGVPPAAPAEQRKPPSGLPETAAVANAAAPVESPTRSGVPAAAPPGRSPLLPRMPRPWQETGDPAPAVVVRDSSWAWSGWLRVLPASAESATVVRGPAPVRRELDSESDLIGLVAPGSRLRVTALRGRWCAVTLDSTEGWIERSVVRLDSAGGRRWPAAATAAALAAIVAAGAALLRTWRTRRPRLRTVTRRARGATARVLVAARRDIPVRQYLADTTVSLDWCLCEVGIEVQRASDMRALRESLKASVPGVVVVDWAFNRAIHDAFRRYLALPIGPAPLVVFCDVPPAALARADRIAQARYLGAGFTDRELFASLTPRLAANAAAAPGGIALEGDIVDTGLAEVMQFIEAGAKTGRLQVQAGGMAASVTFRDGAVVDAAAGSARGAHAALSVLDMKQGTFRFVHENVPAAETARLSTTYLLMEWARLRDENGRSTCATAPLLRRT